MMAPAFGQVVDLEAAEDSPLWWTLSPDLTPAELRAIHRDAEGHLERYLADAAIGQAPSVTPQQAEDLTFYVNGRSTPDLIPFWLAFSMLATQPQTPRESTLEKLGGYGLTPEAESKVRKGLDLQRQGEETLVESIRGPQTAFGSAAHAWLRARGKSAESYRAATRELSQAVKERNPRALAAALGISESEAREYLESREVRPLETTAVGVLPSLHEEVSGEDWRNLQRFLLVEVAAKLGALLDYGWGEDLRGSR